MAFAAISDVVRKILEEPLSANKHQILSLAKTDQEKRAKFEVECVSVPGDLCHLAWSKSDRAIWLRHVGVRRLVNTDCPSAEASKANRAEIECERARERRLKRHATQGVVALFNAVQQHQSVLEKHLDVTGPLVFQREKVVTGFTASDFLDRLSAGLPGAKAKPVKETISDVSSAPKGSKPDSLLSLRTVKAQRR
ncbi:RRP15-like protein [Taenia crassiceps]|uniref:RRP15-like protein n=1 Tax=Taenia crassiceps TaxID=6207 RepID=A0ABR4QEE0_9CEST